MLFQIAETRIHLQGIMRTAYIRQTGCEDNAIHIYFLAHPVRVAVTLPVRSSQRSLNRVTQLGH